MAETVTMLFDSDCGFCTSAANWWLRHLSPSVDGVALAFQQVPDLSVYGTNLASAAQALHVVTASEVAIGGDAVISAFSSLRLPWRIFGTLGRLPLGRAVANWLYPHVAAHRHRLPRSSESCRVDAS